MQKFDFFVQCTKRKNLYFSCIFIPKTELLVALRTTKFFRLNYKNIFSIANRYTKNTRFSLMFGSENYNINKNEQNTQIEYKIYPPPLWKFLPPVWPDPPHSDNPLYPPPNADQLLHVWLTMMKIAEISSSTYTQNIAFTGNFPWKYQF